MLWAQEGPKCRPGSQVSEVISFSENFVLCLKLSSWDKGPESNSLSSWIHSQPHLREKETRHGNDGLGLIHSFLSVRKGPSDLTSFSISFLGGRWEE